MTVGTCEADVAVFPPYSFNAIPCPSLPIDSFLFPPIPFLFPRVYSRQFMEGMTVGTCEADVAVFPFTCSLLHTVGYQGLLCPRIVSLDHMNNSISLWIK